MIRQASTISFLVLSAELFCGGPYGLVILGVQIRWGIWSIAILLSAATLAGRPRDASWQSQVLLGAAALAIIWGIVVPFGRRGTTGLPMALLEARPLVAVAILPCAMAAFDWLGAPRVLRVLGWLLLIPALLTSAAWVEANWIRTTEIADGIQHVLGIEDGRRLMFGPILDETYRVMWVVAMLFPFAILIRSPARLTSFSTWALIMTAGAWASGSRAILASCAIAIAGSLWVYRRRISLAVAPAVIVLVMLLAEDAQKLRIFQLAGEFDEVNPRGEQLRSLLSMFESNQLFGAGLGAVAESIRSEGAEYSYELTYVALLAKVGLIGAVAATAVATLGFSRVFRMRPQARFMAGIATLMFVLETGSNPYLLNLFGMYLLVVLLCVSRDPGLFGRPRRHLTVADDPHIELRASKDAVVPAQLH
jgi:hypothetical protein